MKKRYDKPIPMGWYAIEYSNDLATGDVKAIEYFGRELVLFRTEAGEAKVLDAFCPHLGAHLGHGGKVMGENISCPFHAWQFDGEGMCKKIPYAKRIPPKVDGKQAIGAYHVVEKNQMIWAWYHPQDAKPSWEVEDFEEFSSDEWSEIQSFDWTINTILQETGENAADIAHFVTVHGVSEMPEGEVTWQDHTRVTVLDNKSSTVLSEDGETSQGVEQLSFISKSIGPGQTYQKFFRLFDIVMMGTIAPIDDQSVQLRFSFIFPATQSETNELYANAFRDEIVRQVEQDIPIWEHKRYAANPVLCDGDGPIAKYRKWFEQFYEAEASDETVSEDTIKLVSK